jgi:transcriptional regulator with XRE-family HTH domain
MGSDVRSHPGDLGRRVRHRRTEMGLTRAQVAERAGIDEAVVAYVEEQPAAVRAEIILRLAYALDLPDYSLLGSDADIPPEFPGRRPRLDVLAEPECWQLLDQHGVGRIAFVAERDGSPHIHPLNYAVEDRRLLLRTRQGSLLDATVGQSAEGCPASFEVDRIDVAEHEGWSVLLRGVLTPTDTGTEPAAVEPWAGGVAVRQTCLVPRVTTGRRIFIDLAVQVPAHGSNPGSGRQRRLRSGMAADTHRRPGRLDAGIAGKRAARRPVRVSGRSHR